MKIIPCIQHVFRTHLPVLVILCILLYPDPTSLTAGEDEHPRMFINERRMETIRTRKKMDGSHHQEAFSSLKSKVDEGNLKRFGATDSNHNYARSYLAQSAAFLYQVTRKQKYADQAFSTLQNVYEDPGPDQRLLEKGYGLSRATVGLGFALGYDWCYDAWTEQQRSYVRNKLETSLNAWKSFSHANLGDRRGSNWVAVCRGGELLQLIALGLEDERSDRYEKLKRELALHMKNGYDGYGVSQEGIGYVGYGGIFLLRAVLAAATTGDDELLKRARDHRWWKLAMYTGTFAVIPEPHRLAGRSVYLMNGVGGPNINDEGWASLLPGITKKTDLPYYRYWYDRHMGKRATPGKNPSKKYDPNRAGRVWALLFYPTGVEPKNPADPWPSGIAGEQGLACFRNRWKNENDILVSLAGDSHHHGHAWDQSEALQLGLFAYDTMFIGGPRKERESSLYSKLLIDGKTGRSRDTGTLTSYNTKPDGGYAIVGGGSQYRNLGVRDVKRHLMVRFDDGKNSALISTLDRINSFRKHRYTWNLHHGMPGFDWGIELTETTEKGVPVFTMKGRNQGYLKGWVLTPESISQTVSPNLRISAAGRSTDIWVVMHVGRKQPPVVTSVERFPHGGRVTLGGDRTHTVAYDREAGKLFSGSNAASRDFSSRKRPLSIRKLAARTHADDTVQLSWTQHQTGASELLVQKRRNESQFQTVARIEPDRRTFRVTDLQPETTYTWRIVSRNEHGTSTPSETVSGRTWSKGYELCVEDLAPRENGALPETNALGKWTFANSDNGWQFSSKNGSSRGAEQRSGHLTTGQVEIHKTNAVYTDDISCDLSGSTARIEFDVKDEAVTRFGLMLKRNEEWVVSKNRLYADAKGAWNTFEYNISEVEKWKRADLENLELGDSLELTEEQLSDVQGIGFWASWPINNKWAKLDQIHLYARDVKREEK